MSSFLLQVYIALKYQPPYLLIVVNLSEMFITEFCIQTSFLVNINDLMLIIISYYVLRASQILPADEIKDISYVAWSSSNY